MIFLLFLRFLMPFFTLEKGCVGSTHLTCHFGCRVFDIFRDSFSSRPFRNLTLSMQMASLQMKVKSSRMAYDQLYYGGIELTILYSPLAFTTFTPHHYPRDNTQKPAESNMLLFGEARDVCSSIYLLTVLKFWTGHDRPHAPRDALRAYRGPDGTPCLFRPQLNMERMVRSAERVALPVRVSLPYA